MLFVIPLDSKLLSQMEEYMRPDLELIQFFATEGAKRFVINEKVESLATDVILCNEVQLLVTNEQSLIVATV